MSENLLIAATLRGSALLGVAWLITRPVLRTSAAARHLIWTISLSGLLFMPLLIFVMPQIAIPVDVTAPQVAAWVPPVAARVAASPVNDQPPSVVERSSRSQRVIRKLETSRRPSLPSMSAAGWLLIVWSVIAALLLARLLAGLARVRRLARTACVVDDAASNALARRLAAQLAIDRPIALLGDEDVGVPMTWGIVYPCVLLPIEFCTWDLERQTAVLLHEFAHIKRLDALTQLLAQFVTALFWFNPLVWLAAREMRRQREHACDDCVLACGTRASDYANELLQIARMLSSAPRTPSIALAMARQSEFEGRLLAILDPRVVRRENSRARTLIACLGVAAITLLLATASPVKREAFAAAPIPELMSSVTTPTVPVVARVALRASLRAEKKLPEVDSSIGNIREIATGTAHVDALPPIVVSVAGTSPTVAKLAAPQSSPVDRETLIAVARAAMRITSDYDKAELLVGIASHFDLDADTRRAFAEAAASIVSDYERRRVISAAVVDSLKASPAFRMALLPTLAKFTASYDRRVAITTLAAGQGGAISETIALINAAAAMTADFDKSTTLIAIAQARGVGDSAVRDAFLKAAETIHSSFDHAQAIRALF